MFSDAFLEPAAHGRAFPRILEQSKHGLGQCVSVPGRHQHPALAVNDHLGDAADFGGHNRKARRTGFDVHKSERFCMTR